MSRDARFERAVAPRLAAGQQCFGILCPEHPRLYRKHLALHLLGLRILPLSREGDTKIARGCQRAYQASLRGCCTLGLSARIRVIIQCGIMTEYGKYLVRHNDRFCTEAGLSCTGLGLSARIRVIIQCGIISEYGTYLVRQNFVRRRGYSVQDSAVHWASQPGFG